MKRIITCMIMTILIIGCSKPAEQPVEKKQPVAETRSQPKKSSEPKEATIFSAAAKGQLATVMRLLDEGTDVDSQDETGNTALAWAALRGRGGVAKYLVEHNANPNLANKKGLTPLHQACLFGDKGVIQILVDFGADVNIEGPGSMKAVDIARKMEHQETVEILEKAAAKQAEQK